MKPEQLPKLSVIMAVRNSESTLARALDSLIAQHYPNMEVVVWDGASTDSTLALLGKYAHIITTLKSEKDLGAQDACNKAIGLATGDYIGFLNADDEYEPGFLWAVADKIIAHPGSEVISAGMILCTASTKGYIVKGYYADEKLLNLSLESVLTEWPTFLPSRFFHRDLLAEVGKFNIDRSLWFYSNDREFAARLALRGCRNAIIPKALYRLVMHDKGVSNNPENYTRIVEEHIQIADMLLQRAGLTAEQKRIITSWRKRQVVFGMWNAVLKAKFEQAFDFAKQGIAIAGWTFPALSVYILAEKSLKRICLMLSHGIASR